MLLAFLVIMLAIAFAFEYVIRQNTKDTQYFIQGDWHIRHKDTLDVLFVGNSRTWVQVDAELFSKETHTNSYCLSQDGRDSKLIWRKFKKFLELNNKPRYVFLQFDPSMTIEAGLNQLTFYGKENYITYLFFNNLGINDIFKEEKGFHTYDEYIPLVRYIGYSKLFMRHLFKRVVVDSPKLTDNYQTFKYGTYPRELKFGALSNKVHWYEPKIANGRIVTRYIDSIKAICDRENIKMIWYFPPQSYISYEKIDSLQLKVMDSCLERDKPLFWNFNSERFNDSSIFYNHWHLNKTGAEKFTRQLIDSFKLYLEKEKNTHTAE